MAARARGIGFAARARVVSTKGSKNVIGLAYTQRRGIAAVGIGVALERWNGRAARKERHRTPQNERPRSCRPPYASELHARSTETVSGPIHGGRAIGRLACVIVPCAAPTK